jgi:hypothetical protein
VLGQRPRLPASRHGLLALEQLDQLLVQGELAVVEGPFEPVRRSADPADLPTDGLALVLGELLPAQLRDQPAQGGDEPVAGADQVEVLDGVLDRTDSWSAFANADVVLTAPEAGVPLLFIEVDNCTEEAVLIGRKFEKYARFFKRKEKDTDGIEKPMWRTRWSAPEWEGYERVHPPVLLVFHQVGKRSARSQMAKVADLTRVHWQGKWDSEDGFHSYDGCIPVVATTLELLREHGPAGPAFWRFGRKERQPLLDAIGNPRRDAALARRRQAVREEQRRRTEREAAARDARRPVCAD